MTSPSPTAQRSVLVTGGASGMGRATALLLARDGVAVTVVDRAADAAKDVAREITSSGGSALAAPGDVGDEKEVAAAVASAVDAFGGLDGVVTSAGVFHANDLRPLGDVDLDDFLFVLRVNLAGTFLAIKHAIPHLVARRGAIVTIASTAALKGHGYGSGYTASKGGVAALTRLAAVQYGPQGVRVNCICPGGVDTPMTAGAWNTPAAQENIRRNVPLQRVAQPEEIASVAAFLLSNAAADLTGQTIAVDGGSTIA
jgi:NAD(P)-dependent dehydrogenase (short-subunit alcohol dehydrogenase family)